MCVYACAMRYRTEEHVDTMMRCIAVCVCQELKCVLGLMPVSKLTLRKKKD